MSLALPAFSFDHAQFFLTIAGCNHDLSVRSLECWNDSISEDYLFTLDIVTSQFSSVEQWLNQKAQLNWDAIIRHGMISSVVYLGQMIDGHLYRIGFSSLFYPLKLRQQHRVYLNKTLTEIITDIFNSAGITHFRLQLPRWQEKENYIVQFQQTDWDFLNHLLLRFGLQFIWLQEASCATALVVDQLSLFNNHFKTLTIDTLTNAESAQLLPQQVFFDDYNPRTPSLSLAQNTQNQTTLHGLGYWEVYGSNYLTPEEGLEKTQLRQGQIDTERYAFEVTTTERTCMPGQLVMIDGQTWRIANIRHQVKTNNAAIDVQHAPHYQAQLNLIPPQQIYYFHHPLQPLQTNTHGVFCAKTETTGGDYAYLDQHGDYVVRQPFDASNSPPTEGSLPVRATQPHGGTPTQSLNFGMHFPLRANTEVAIGNLYGDVSRPVLLGALANPDTPNPVNADNHTQNLMRTWRGNTLCLDDHVQKNQIHLNTPAKLNHLLLDATDDMHQVKLHTQQGQTHIEAHKNLAISSTDDHILQVADLAQITVTKNQQVESQQNLQMQSGQNIALNSQQHILLQTEQQNIALQSQAQTTIQAHQGFFAQGHTVVLNNQSGDLTLFAKNQLHLESNQALELNGGNAISMQGGNLTLQASNLHVIASTINMPKPAGGGSGGNMNVSGNAINITMDALNIALGIGECIGGVPLDETGAGEVMQEDGARRIIITAEEMTGKSRSEIKALAEEKGLRSNYVK